MSIENTVQSSERDLALRDEFRGYIIMIREDIARITNGLPDTSAEAKDLRWLIKDLDKTRTELRHLEARIAHETDADPTQIFDFDTAKRSIGCRLDRLRDAYSPKDVSG